MESVHVVEGQQVDELLYELHREEMTGTVKVHAAPTETWCIGDNGSRQLEHLKQRLRRCVGKRFPKCLDAIEDASSRSSLKGNTLAIDSEHITLLRCHLWRHGQFDITHFLSALLDDREVNAHHIAEVVLQELSLLLQG